jgi:hypothetical protein
VAINPALAKRAVPKKFIAGPWGIRYAPYDQGDWTGFTKAHTHPEPWHREVVRQSSGLVVNRWDITGKRLVPYVRPDTAVNVRGHRKASKYIQPSKKRFPGQARRLDVHPLVRNALRANREQPIYLCLEGCLKADAVAGTGRLAFSVPSVTLWRLEEEHLAPWLPMVRRAPTVYVIPDSDYHPKWRGYGSGEEPVFVNGGEVRFFTDRCAIFLRRQGARVRYLVPPYLSAEEALAQGMTLEERWKIGIDDHIRMGRNWEPWSKDNPEGLIDFEYRRGPWLHLPAKPRTDKRADKRDRLLLDHLEQTRGPVGLFAVQDVADELGKNRNTVRKAAKSCVERGVLELWPGSPLGEGKGNKPHVFRFSTIGPKQAPQAA